MSEVLPFNSRFQLLQRYGNPMIHPDHWESRHIVGIHAATATKNILIRCNADIAPLLQQGFHTLREQGLIAEVHTFDGCYVPRTQRGNPERISLHAYGLAFDLNASTNRQGTKGDMDRRIVAVFADLGFYWGGKFRRLSDPMHFEYTKCGL